MVCSRYPKEYRYYERVLKKKCFRKLQNNLWENKTKWILIEKADRHLRLKLLYKYINYWVAFLNERYRKKINVRAAEALHEDKLKARGVLALKRNVEINRMLFRVCERKFELNLKYRCWHQWKHYVEKRLKVKEIKLLANRIRAERLSLRFFYLWSFRLKEKRAFQNAFKAAAVKHETKIKEKCFKSWKIFTSGQICKRKLHSVAVVYYQDKLKEKFFRCWKNYSAQKKLYRYKTNVIQTFYENYLIKNYLNEWFTAYKELKLQKKAYKYNLGVDFYRRVLLRRSFWILWRNRERKRLKQEKVQKFRNIYIRVYLNVWVEKRNEKILWNYFEKKATEWRKNYLRESCLSKFWQKYQEGIEEKEKMAKVTWYSDAIIVHKAFRGWCGVIERKISKKLQLEKAVRFYLERLTKKTFEKWKKFVGKRSRKRMAAGYCRYILLSWALDQWKAFITETKLKLEKAENLKRKHSKNVMKVVFICWRDETRISVSKRNTAIDFCNKLKLSKAFYTWRKNIKMKTVTKNHYKCNKLILDNIIIKNAIYRWYEMHLVKQNLRRKVLEFKSRQEKRSLKSRFDTWRRFVEKIKILEEKVNFYSRMKSNILMEDYLVLMAEAVRNKKIFMRKEESARRGEEKLLKRKYLRRWLSFICWKKERLLKCVTEERKFGSKEVFVPVWTKTRRKPMIPSYLKPGLPVGSLAEEEVNEKTYRLEHPVNKKLPVVGKSETFAFFEF